MELQAEVCGGAPGAARFSCNPQQERRTIASGAQPGASSVTSQSEVLRATAAAAGTPAGTTLDALQAHILALKATWDPLWEEYLKPRWRRQRLALYRAQERIIEGFCKKVANAPGGIGGAGTADSLPNACQVGIDFEVALGLSVSVTLGDQVQLTQSLTLLGDQLGFALAPGILGGPGATGAGAGVGLGGGPGVVVAGRRQTLEQDPDSSRPNATVPSRSSLDKAVTPGGNRPSTGLRNNATSAANGTLGRAASSSPSLVAASDNNSSRLSAQDAARTQGPLANGSLPEPGGVTPSTTLLVLELAG
ncbi:hypothetical protein QJQ45_016104, partial [Haematococcus lacustris]